MPITDVDYPVIETALRQLRKRVRQVGAACMLSGDLTDAQIALNHATSLECATTELERILAWLQTVEESEPLPLSLELIETEREPVGEVPDAFRINGLLHTESTPALEHEPEPEPELAPEPIVGPVPTLVAEKVTEATVSPDLPRSAVIEPPALSPADRRKHGKMAESYFKLMLKEGRDVANLSVTTPGAFSRWKRVVCGLRCIVTEYPDLTWAESAQEELAQMRMESGRWPNAIFYGLNDHRYEAKGTWCNLAEVYRHAARAENLLAVTGLGLNDASQATAIVVNYASAVAAVWDRTLAWRTAGAADREVEELRARIRRLDPSSRPLRIKTDDELTRTQAHLAELERIADQATKNIHHRDDRKDALAALISLVADPCGDDLAEQLNAAVRRALAARVPYSNQAMTNALLPFRSLLDEDDDLKAVRNHLDKQLLLLLAKHQLPRDVPVEENEDLIRRRVEVQALMQGKRVLIVGGKKVHASKISGLKEALGCAELDWPDSEDHTHISTFDAPMRRADFVLMIVKWSRHSYKLVIDAAKVLGKGTVQVVSGLGENRVILDVHRQLIECVRDDAKSAGNSVPARNGR